jgi:hypothetical protein
MALKTIEYGVQQDLVKQSPSRDRLHKFNADFYSSDVRIISLVLIPLVLRDAILERIVRYRRRR